MLFLILSPRTDEVCFLFLAFGISVLRMMYDNYTVVIFILRTRPSILYEKVGKDRVAHVNSFFCEADQAVVVFEVA